MNRVTEVREAALQAIERVQASVRASSRCEPLRMVSPTPPDTKRTLQRLEQSMSVLTSDGKTCRVDVDCIDRSQLLKQLTDTTGPDQAQVPVSQAALHLWLQHVHASGRSMSSKRARGATTRCEPCSHSRLRRDTSPLPQGGNSQREGSSVVAEEATEAELCQIIMASDILIDEDTKLSAAERLARLLQPDPAHDIVPVADQVALLPEHLLLEVLKFVPLHHALRYLPATFHSDTIRAHHPSIDSNHSLHLSRTPPDLMHAALATTATLHALQDLSLASSTFPDACSTCVALLQPLSSITALDMKDTGFRVNAAAALAAVLPAMPQLQSLNFSQNRCTAAALKALAPGLRSCPQLNSLDLSRLIIPTVSHQPGGMKPILQQLVHAVAPLTRLTALAFGISDFLFYSDLFQFDLSYIAAERVVDKLLRAIRGLPQLNLLELNIPWLNMTRPLATRVAAALAANGKLTRLHLAVACALPCPRMAAAPVPGAFTLPSGLTALHMQIGHFSGGIPMLPDMGAGALAMLRELRMEVRSDTQWQTAHAVGYALAEALHHLTRLTKLHFVAARVRDNWQPVAELAQEAEAALIHAAAPALRDVRLPLCVHDSKVVPLVAALHSATQLQRLGVDLMVMAGQVNSAAWKTVGRLLPHISAACMMHTHGYDPPMCLQPFAAAAGCPGNLRALMVDAAVRVRAELLEHRGTPPSELQALLNSVSCMTSLQQLHLVLNRRPLPATANVVDRLLDVGPFCKGLCSLASLTRLHWEVPDSGSAGHYQIEVMRACTSVKQLRVLELGVLRPDAYDVFRSVVPQLPLGQLGVMVMDGAGVEVVTEVRLCLPHLRTEAV